jgi:hypothetical protein
VGTDIGVTTVVVLETSSGVSWQIGDRLTKDPKFDGLRGRFGLRTGLGSTSVLLDDTSPYLLDEEAERSVIDLRRGAGSFF